MPALLFKFQPKLINVSPRYFKNRVLTSYLFDLSNISFSLLIAQDLLCKFKTEKGIAKQALSFLLFSVWATVGLPPGYLQNQKVLGYKDDFWQATNDHFELNKYPPFFPFVMPGFSTATGAQHGCYPQLWFTLDQIGLSVTCQSMSLRVTSAVLWTRCLLDVCLFQLLQLISQICGFFCCFIPTSFIEFFTSVYQEVSVQSCSKKGNKWIIYLISLCEEKLLYYYSLRPGLGTQMKL